jgi:EmrB/QacA subfamily drug resistance transporter
MSPIEAYTVRFGRHYKWYATVTVMLGTIATTAAATMVNVALPDIMGAFGLGQDQVQWLSTGFLAAMTATMLASAWSLGRFGYRVSFIGALVLFIAGSIAGALSGSGEAVILARVMQGAASGLIQPMAMVVMAQVFPREKRGQAMGIYGVGVVLAPALGPTLGGFLVDQYSWRDVFLTIVPVCAAAIAAASVFLPGREVRPTKAAFDGLGFVLLIGFLVTLLTGLSNGQRDGWDDDLILTMFAATIVSGIAFVVRELTCTTPLLNLRVFSNGRFVASCLVSLALGAGIYGSTYIVPMFVQTVQGYTPTRSGLLLMPAGFVLALVFPIAGHLSDRLPPWLPVMIGLALFGCSNWLCGGADVDTSLLSLASWLVIGRIGLGLITPALNAGALRALPPELLSQGAGSLNFVRQFGGALGVNLLSVAVERRTTFHGDALAQAITPGTSAATTAVQQLGLALLHWGNPFGTRLPGDLPPAAMAYLETMLEPKARLLAYQDGFLLVAAMFLAALVPAWLMRRQRDRAVMPTRINSDRSRRPPNPSWPAKAGHPRL